MIREFTDESGTRWLVWSTVPSPSGVMGTMRDGWLTFDSNTVRRRLIPIPPGWEDAPPERLNLLCRAAAEVRRTPATGFEALPDMTTDTATDPKKK